MEYHTHETNIKRENRESKREREIYTGTESDGNTMAQGMGST